MIRGTAVGPGGRRVLMFGISEGNVRHLRNDKPMHISLDDMGIAADLVIFYGKSEEALAKLVKPLIGSETILHDRRHEKKQ